MRWRLISGRRAIVVIGTAAAILNSGTLAQSGRSRCAEISDSLLRLRCYDRTANSTTPPRSRANSNPRDLIRLWHEANATCRGSTDPNPPETLEACKVRETLGSQLDRLNWCYGKNGEYGFQMKGHRCTGSSMRPG